MHARAQPHGPLHCPTSGDPRSHSVGHLGFGVAVRKIPPPAAARPQKAQSLLADTPLGTWRGLLREPPGLYEDHIEPDAKCHRELLHCLQRGVPHASLKATDVRAIKPCAERSLFLAFLGLLAEVSKGRTDEGRDIHAATFVRCSICFNGI